MDETRAAIDPSTLRAAVVARARRPARIVLGLIAAIALLLVVPGWLLAVSGISDALRLPTVPTVVLLGWLVPICLVTMRIPTRRFTHRHLGLAMLLLVSTPSLIAGGHALTDPTNLPPMLIDIPLLVWVVSAPTTIVLLSPMLTLGVGIWSAAQSVVIALLAAPYVDAVSGPPLLIEVLSGPGPIARRAVFIASVGALSAVITLIIRSTYEALISEQRAHDREARARASAEIARRHHEAESERKTRFLGALSHGLRTPLQGVQAHAARLLHSMLTADQARSATIIRDNGWRLLAVLEDALDNARDASRQDDSTDGETEIRTAASAVVELFAAQAEAAGVSLTMRASPAVPARVPGARWQWRQMLSNLVSNAIKNTPSGAITVELDGRPDAFELRVVDSGVGIAEADQAGLFAPFRQAGDPVRKDEGHGLGLALCRDLAEGLGGSIALQSALGIGTTVRVSVPLGPSTPAVGPPITTFPPPGAVASLRRLALRGDLGGVVQLAEARAAAAADLIPFVERIRALADDFDDAAILALLDRARSEEEVSDGPR